MSRERKISIGVVSLGAVALCEPESGFPVGGAELQLYLLGKRLAKEADLDVTLYVADLGQAERERKGLRLCPLVSMGKSLRLGVGKAVAIVWRLMRARHDVYITRSASGINGLVSFAAGRAGGKHLHMCAHDYEAVGRLDETLSFVARKLHNFAITRADAITCQTPIQQTALRSSCRCEAVIVPNLLSPAFPQSSASRNGVLWVGRDVEWKRPELFVALARRMPKCSFTMVCQEQPDRDVNRLGSSAPANLRVFCGLPFDEASHLFGAHKVFVNTSTAEGFPNTFLQAAQAGTPVVSLAVDPQDVLASSGAGCVCNGSVDVLARQVEQLCADEGAWHGYHERAMALAMAQRQLEKQAVDTVRELAQGK